MTVALAADGLTITAEHGPLVRDVSFTVARGGSLTILGETGSGKSLLSQVVMGTLPAGLTATGTVVIEGVSSGAGSGERRRLWGRTLALLPQEPWRSLDPTMRSVPQVAEGYAKVTQDVALARAELALRGLGLSGAGHFYPFMLSGGMAQRVALAATTAGGASIVIVDEPTKGLDANLRDDAVAVLLGVLASGRTLLTITHDVHVARALGGTVAVMLDGAIVEQGSAEDVLGAPRHAYTRRLLEAEPSAWPSRPVFPLGAPILTGTGLTKRYGPKTLFENVDLQVRAGQRLAVVGASGSGKTTLGDVLLGVTHADRGRVVRDPALPPIRFQKLYQDPPASFAPRVTIRRSMDDLVAKHRLEPSEIPRVMARLRLSPILLDRRPDQVSGGELQRFAILRILLLSPAFIFADEPTSRLDPITQQETIDLLVDHAAERGCALLLVTHDARIAANVAQRAVLRLGCV
ncbi:MAG: ABC transporter ATP-binding protein [Vicinamibacterales bacterium]